MINWVERLFIFLDKFKLFFFKFQVIPVPDEINFLRKPYSCLTWLKKKILSSF